MRMTLATLLLAASLIFPVLLNGQTFTNSLVGIACAVASVAMAVRPARDRGGPGARRLWGGIVSGLGVLVAVVLAVGLPSAYRFQTGFNRRVKDLRRQHQRADALGSAALRAQRPLASFNEQ